VGPDDNSGRLNLMTAQSRAAALARADWSRVFDLAVDYFIGLPSWAAAGDLRYQVWMTDTPEGSVNDLAAGVPASVHKKYSYCGDSISMYTHTDTHIDTLNHLNHLGHYGQFWNGRKAEKDLGSRQWLRGGADECPPIASRGSCSTSPRPVASTACRMATASSRETWPGRPRSRARRCRTAM